MQAASTLVSFMPWSVVIFFSSSHALSSANSGPLSSTSLPLSLPLQAGTHLINSSFFLSCSSSSSLITPIFLFLFHFPPPPALTIFS
ncbi:hypothetical protein K457DRAFT_1477915 [Linnemannia elongata AG-77]|uniref:REJ domain-containing protein n=1 Tax=Linnemannia elongata AG-77 TaxID=1314771 RepID=A0A197JSU5_9FUNG|nr:hypothetical protein K457DRAFT_1477915 [Linnemannia elongata AG-77]